MNKIKFGAIGLIMLAIQSYGNTGFLLLPNPTNTIVTIYTNVITEFRINTDDINGILRMSTPIIGEDGKFGRSLNAGYLTISASGDEEGVTRLNRLLNGSIIVNDAELKAAATSLGLDWVTSTGMDQFQIELLAFITKIAQTCNFDNNWVQQTYVQLMMWVGAQMQ